MSMTAPGTIPYPTLAPRVAFFPSGHGISTADLRQNSEEKSPNARGVRGGGVPVKKNQKNVSETRPFPSNGNASVLCHSKSILGPAKKKNHQHTFAMTISESGEKTGKLSAQQWKEQGGEEMYPFDSRMRSIALSALEDGPGADLEVDNKFLFCCIRRCTFHGRMEMACFRRPSAHAIGAFSIFGICHHQGRRL